MNNIIFLLLLGRIAAEDLKHRRIPNFLVICLLLWGIYSNGMTGEWNSSVKGALLAGGSMLIFYIVFRRGIGAGDVKLLTVVGFYVGCRKNLGAIVFDFSDGSGMGNIMQKGGSSGNLRISGRRLSDVGTNLTGGFYEVFICFLHRYWNTKKE